MKHNGWFEKPGVRVLEGRWQHFLEPLPEDPHERRTYVHNREVFKMMTHAQKKRTSGFGSGVPVEGLISQGLISPECDGDKVDLGKFDVVYFDTFNDGYLGHFTFIKHVPRLLRSPESRFSYFNGHCVDDLTQYKVLYLVSPSTY
jgi:protein arginine N-methyltransferase 2